MAKQKDDHVVIALVKDQDAAKAAEKSLKQWDKSDKDVKLGNIGSAAARFTLLTGDTVSGSPEFWGVAKIQAIEKGLDPQQA